MFRLKGLGLFLCFAFSIALKAQEEINSFTRTDTLEIIKSTDIVGIPIAFYTPETNFGFGAGLQFIFNDIRNVFNSRLSNMLVTGVYTLKNQFLLEASPQFHIYEGQFFLKGFFRYKIYPNNFWGIGNSTLDSDLEKYSMTSTQVTAMLQKRMPPDVTFGFEFNFEKHKITEYNEEGSLILQEIPGSEGAVITSLAGVFTFDDRDNIYSTIKGNYIHLSAGFSARTLGASYSFNKYIFDLRKYYPLLSDLTLAGQCYFEMTYGDVPFQAKPWLGGPDKARGYFKGRYIDDHYYTLQGELRWHFTDRFILVGFVSGAEVADNIVNIFSDIKGSCGGGLRFQISKKSPTYVRLDLGFGRANNSGVYFGVNEAF